MKLFEKISKELQDGLPDPVIPLDDAEAIYGLMSDFDGDDNTGSWAIWNPKNIKNKDDLEFVARNKHLINPAYMFLGMNQSIEVKKDGIFHTEACSDTFAKAVMNGPLRPYYGGFITDLLNITGEDGKVFKEADSAKVAAYFKTDGGKKNLIEAKDLFHRKLKALQFLSGTPVTIVAMGDMVYDFATNWLPGRKIIKIPHPARYGITDDDYHAHAALALADGNLDNVDDLYLDNATAIVDTKKAGELKVRLARKLKKSIITRYAPALEATSEIMTVINNIVASYRKELESISISDAAKRFRMNTINKLNSYLGDVDIKNEFLVSMEDKINKYTDEGENHFEPYEMEELEIITVEFGSKPNQKIMYKDEAKGFIMTGRKVIDPNYVLRAAGINIKRESVDIEQIFDNMLKG